ncbi:MAG: Ni/Fe-hydrogenase, b-type cytochrome subunit [candidate division KSB1 bacterium]|nr:Ni/Fe-hydrogenase, b-type cytochrome subunit [candidate division KSB1 bacterium]MDZ7274115.1 Ni/Fe-hydrogenase, b-type cytochrome subunit [candidate division KSB1 bacterium]MDZ7287841.1 Ni/Fe-hydrogenase, b-type cytochrome subunit [candidate division KSB1 bacterium]MDZ7296713.1 Ni/Fe-hydrogenase, b-type cytochrome subunit [candidate division KSB1 bacterium]MDZ7309567.1 Ni/Fe-hydrogenase, b-type cytochrome subunit [candidate division KSB1 bacterium]
MATTSTGVAYRRVYVWQLPVRFYHWLNALCVAVLIVTGYLIGNPLAISYSTEAYQQYWFGTVRFVHFVAAFIFFFNFMVRIYWGFVGNQYARWENFIPFRKAQWREILEVLKVDVLQAKIKGLISIGHNALAGVTYFLSFLAFLFQSLTGFALYSSMSDSFFPRLFAWIVPLMGGDFAVRQWHHLFLWFFVVFIIVHMYLVFYHDYIEGRGTTSSMVGGWKFEREDVFREQ